MMGCISNQQAYEEMCDKARKYDEMVGVLQEIRQEIDSHCSDNRDRNDGLYIAMKIIDKHIKEYTE